MRHLLFIELIDARYSKANLQVSSERSGERVLLTICGAAHHKRHLAKAQAVCSTLCCRELIVDTADLIGKLIVGVNSLTIQRQYLVALLQTYLPSRCLYRVFAALRHRQTLQHSINDSRSKRSHETRRRLQHTQQIDVPGQRDAHLLAATNDVGIVSFGKVTVDINIEVLERTLVGTHQDIMVAETKLLGFCIELHALAHISHAYITFAPVKHDHGVDKKCQHKVHRHASHHDDEPLPRRFGAELPRLRVTLHLVGVHALVDHTGYLAIAT